MRRGNNTYTKYGEWPGKCCFQLQLKIILLVKKFENQLIQKENLKKSGTCYGNKPDAMELHLNGLIKNCKQDKNYSVRYSFEETAFFESICSTPPSQAKHFCLISSSCESRPRGPHPRTLLFLQSQTVVP
jgi:hypothetical protein